MHPRSRSSEPGSAPGAIEVEIEPAREHRDLAAEWRALEERADCSMFLTWRWIGAWLAELPREIEVLCLRARHDGETVGLALLCWRQVRRRGVIRAAQLHLHETGHLHFDQLTVEYNDFLVDRRMIGEVRRAMLGSLMGWRDLWDELTLAGVDPSFADSLGEVAGTVNMRKEIHPYVDLGAIADGACLAALGPNTRHQIRRTMRLCGDPRLEMATTPAEAAIFFDGLCEQHHQVWQPRGMAGAFWNDFLQAFHRRVIAEGAADGFVQLLRSRAGDGRILGHLYNVVHRGRVYAYQSGFAPNDDNRVKPGLLTHHLAIVLNKARGARFYDFMAGDVRYKRSLSNRAGEMLWIVIQRPRLDFAIERRLRDLKNHLDARLYGRRDAAASGG